MLLRVNEWARDLYTPHSDFDVDFVLASGGRGSSKTYEITQALTLKGTLEPLRICVAREHLKSIEESAKQEIEQRARSLGVLNPQGYTVTLNKIDHANGTHLFFIGLSKLSEEDIKGLSDVDIVWVEEAHKMSHSSWELLRPTIRKDRSQIWASWNDRFRTDAISKFKDAMRHDSRVWYCKVNYRQNAFFTEKSNRDRLRDKILNPDRYPHIWEGEYDDASAKRKVLPYALLQICVDAWDKRPTRGAFVDAGFDVADTGSDKNALALRAGPELFDLTTWRGSEAFTPSHSTRKVKNRLDDEDTNRLFYDAGGVGAGVRGPLMELNPTFRVRGVQFGGKVQMPDVTFIKRSNAGGKTNKEYFQNWASQAGWVLRLRANNTQRLVNGEDIDPHKCLFINPDIKNLEDILAELSQPEWDDNDGKLKINKKPREPGEQEPPSPDCYDAAIMAFSGDAGRIYRLLVA